ncbi:hypothetical protein Aduo_019378 [Ancylostoma duodenale]
MERKLASFLPNTNTNRSTRCSLLRHDKPRKEERKRDPRTVYEVLPPLRCAHDRGGDRQPPLEAEMVNCETEDVELDRGTEFYQKTLIVNNMEKQLSSDEMSMDVEEQVENNAEASPDAAPQGGNEVVRSERNVDYRMILPDEMLDDWGDVTSSPIVITVSRLGCPEDDDLVRKFLSQFPTVRFNKEVTSTTTHLIMMNTRERSCPKRSLRYVYAVAHKCMLLNRCWLEECVKSKRLVDSTKYALTGELPRGIPGWVISRWMPKSPLFKNMKFFLPKTFSDSKLIPREDSFRKIIELITLCGGSCYDKPWEVEGAQEAYTIFMPRSREWDAAYRYEASMNNVPVVVADFVLDSISRFTIQPIHPYRVRRGG